MNGNKISAICCFLLNSIFVLYVQAQTTTTKKSSTATYNTTPIKVDGIMDEAIWESSEVATSFIENNPEPGSLSSQKTVVKVLYDNKAIYLGVRLFDTKPDSILRQLTQRDEIGNTDYFAVLIDTYQDGLNGAGFVLTPAGVQYDCKYSSLESGNGIFDGDANWNAVWKGEVQLDAEGWMLEMKIPYSAIRFPQKAEQVWHINFARSIRRTRELYYWNEVNPEENGLLQQSGKLLGIKDIKSPVRLSATPFLALYLENYYDKNNDPASSFSRAFSGGMDIKYGINDAFTLDMTLIPDFGQVQSDNQVLNLSPFEIRFDENRQFFTEGTELFNKADIFYSRRVGTTPIFYGAVADQLETGETILDNPSTTQLVNATKISGRSSGGLGLGFFNANSLASKARIETKAGEEREVETNPFSNYNVLVFDKNLKNNSFVTLINTNVWRSGSAYDANVTGTEFSLRNRKNKYGINGKAVLSQLYNTDGVDLGHEVALEARKISGEFTWALGYNQLSDDYDINDLGFLNNNNERTLSFEYKYSRFKPFGIFNGTRLGFETSYSRLYDPNKYSNVEMEFFARLFTRKFFAFGTWQYFSPVDGHDYFEPRTNDFSQFFLRPKYWGSGFWISSDYRKKFALDVRVEYFVAPANDNNGYGINVAPRFRLSDKLSFIFDVNYNNYKNDFGFTAPKTAAESYELLPESAIVFSKRNQETFTNVLTATYSFSNKMGLSFRGRHYWTQVDYKGFYQLGAGGLLEDTAYEGLDAAGNNLHQTNVNIFNIDMIYNWRFAPGSDIFLVWKNAIFTSNDELNSSYLQNFTHLYKAPQSNSLSLKIIYYLDYLQFQRG